MIVKLGTGSAYVAVLAAIFVAAAIPASHAQVMTPRPPTARQTITLRLGHLDVYTIARPFKTIVVGDPKIVDTQAVTDRTIIITPQSRGRNNYPFSRRAKRAAQLSLHKRRCGRAGSGEGSQQGHY